MRIDAHHHVWDLSVREQDWIQDDQLSPLLRDFSIEDLAPELEAAGIDRTVLVQTVACGREMPAPAPPGDNRTTHGLPCVTFGHDAPVDRLSDTNPETQNPAC